jgi:hypothetical protein
MTYLDTAMAAGILGAFGGVSVHPCVVSVLASIRKM